MSSMPPPATPPAASPPPSAPQASGWSAAVPTRAGPAAGLVYSGFWVRVVAFVIDAIATGIIASALAPIFGAGMIVDATPDRLDINYAYGGVNALVGLVYYIGFWSWRGQTVGMMPFNLRVVHADTGEKIDVVRGLLRYVGLIISFVVLLLGVIWVAFDARKQGWHDKMANTLVVRPG